MLYSVDVMLYKGQRARRLVRADSDVSKRGGDWRALYGAICTRRRAEGNF